MAMKLHLTVAILLLCVLTEVPLQKTVVVEADLVVPRDPNSKPVPILDCAALCAGRCSQHSRPNLCARACGTCCSRCKCVPPGTSGNREMCGTCYTNMTTHGNRTKCP
uniref:Snakin-2-like n=1 Tax=Ananas comosus var. bracteatus TaxID=296719 RepID=A0A6V7P6Y2_ANACO|nr:unnamed protein product [Ananas comosus var. bracteatus]